MSAETPRELLAESLRGHHLNTLSQDSGQHCTCGSDSRFEQHGGDLPWSSFEEHLANAALASPALDALVAERVTALAEDAALIEAARKAIEDELIDWRDEHRFMVCGNGFSVCEKDGTPSPIIRFRTDIGFRIGLHALAAALTERRPTDD